jgi:SIR2-like domain
MAHGAIAPNPPEEEEGVILLTGAGASAYLGLRTLESIVDPISGVRIPLNDKVSETIQSTWKKVKASKGRGATFEEVIGQLNEYLRCADLMAHDYVFNSVLGQVPYQVATGEFAKIWEDALMECYSIMLEFYGPNRIMTDNKAFNYIIEFLKSLGTINQNRLHIFTTNYDCSYHVIASNTNKLSFVTHIENEKSGHFRDTWYYTRPDLKNKNTPLVYLHRLHGCVAWFSDSKAPYGLYEIYGAGDELVISDPKYLNQMKIKLVSSEQIGTNPAFSLAFNEFYDQLKSCKVLLVWGHSFRDIEVLRTIKNAIETRTTPLEILYLDLYMTEEEAIRRIRDTLAGDPLGIGTSLKAKRILWDGDDKLIAVTKAAIRKALRIKG